MKMLSGMIGPILFGVAVICAYFFHATYYRWRGCFDATGRCFDPQTGVVYHQQAGLVWGVLFCVAIVGAIGGSRLFRNRT